LIIEETVQHISSLPFVLSSKLPVQLFLMMRTGLLLLTICFSFVLKAQDHSLNAKVFNEQNVAVEGATVELLSVTNLKPVRTAISGKNGEAVLLRIAEGKYKLRISYAGYESIVTDVSLPSAEIHSVQLKISSGELSNVTVRTSKPFIQHTQGKTIVNVEAGVTNAGTTVLEVLEKSPGVLVDRNGGISLQNKAGVLVLIDDKPTYLTGTDLSNMLAGMSSSNVESIELITNPSAKYDAAGNAGIINIKTKKNKLVGFNGNLSIAAGIGRYPKNNNSLALNYRNGKFNTFLTYSSNWNKSFTDIYALREYKNNSGAVIATLDQPTGFISKGFSNTLKVGADYYLNARTTVGASVTGLLVNREGTNRATANWLNAQGALDSAVITDGSSSNRFRNAAVNIGLKHTVNKEQEFSVDVDAAKYRLTNEQFFSSYKTASSAPAESTTGSIPSEIKIFSFKADHTLRFGNSKLESGMKTSRIDTDNDANYRLSKGFGWQQDYGKTNHFLYDESIHAAYASLEQKMKRVTMQAGLRYEYTHFDAHQLGNIQVKDSSFSRNYDGFFPSGYLNYEADSSNSFTITVGRRIDRPAFQRLNPFVNIINKYTIERGNPFFRPQMTWNFEVSHHYKQLITTTVSYALIKDYFSQLFLTDPDGTLVYTQGNVGRMHNISGSVMTTTSPAKWWTLNAQAIYCYKKLIGYVWNNYTSTVSQLNISMNNQFKLGKGVTGEVSGFYTGRARNDLQEVLDPAGQLSAGVAIPVLKKQGTLRLTVRDIFWTNWMEGVTDFQNAEEYFKLRRDSRVFNAAFSYRFGKAYKSTKRNSGAATDEMQRVNL
jgi:iron complex outermembrane receptor protein